MGGRVAPVLAAVAAVAALLVAASGGDPPAARTVAVTVDGPRDGRRIPDSFLGLSIEYQSVPLYFGSPAAPNAAFDGLVAALADAQGAPVGLRLGGNSSDQSWWNPSRRERPPGVLYDVGPAWAGDVAAAQRRLRAPLALGVNLALNDPANAVALVEAIRRAGLTPPGLAALEIGNEPELYARGRTFRVGRSLVVRPRQRVSYSARQYASEARRYIDVLRARAAGPIAIGGYISAAWTREALSALGGETDELLAHAYALAACNPSTGAAELRARLLTAAAARGLVRYLAPYAGRGLPIRVSEFNSAVCGGVAGVSDTFAAALWAPDALFELARAGARQVDVHTWADAYYAPFAFTATREGTVATVRPLYYGLLLFARAAPAGSELRTVRVSDPNRGLAAWATSDPDGATRVLLINRDVRHARRVRLALGGPARTGSLQRLLAPGPQALTETTLAGQRVGRGTASGRLEGRLATEPVAIRGGTTTLTLPAASAALVLDD